MRRMVTVAVVLGLLAIGGAVWVGQWWERPLSGVGSECRVTADGEVTLDHEQMAHAATIAAVGVRLDMPPRAVVVALATAMQESKLRNLPHLGTQNDHDSVGLFQQRPSQGWGTADEIADPTYATERFYRALHTVDGWQTMRVTEAAQRVQRSAYPEAYQQWAPDARVLSRALLGRVGGAVACRVTASTAPARGPVAVDRLRGALAAQWGQDADRRAAEVVAQELAAVTGAAPAGAAAVSLEAVDHRAGWRYAHWLVAHAGAHGVQRIHFHDQVWRADSGRWETTDDTRDHVLAELHPVS